jgi:hypothetical protein
MELLQLKHLFLQAVAAALMVQAVAAAQVV